jgi:hypothetical protein
MPAQDLSQRREFEKQLVMMHMPSFSISESSDGHMTLEGFVKTIAGRNRYRGRLVCTPNFPYEVPRLYILSPKPLWTHDHTGTLNALNGSSEHHVYRTEPDGFLEICHTPKWDASQTCIAVLIKLHLWVEAYETYLECGGTVGRYLAKSAKASPGQPVTA